MRALTYCFLLFVTGVCLIAVLACSNETGSDLYKTAEFEELQNNKEHAIQLYETIIKKFPDSDYADKAREKLTDLQK
jgi:outer membrane protein assembly factor BamD (BamD/ComL family)